MCLLCSVTCSTLLFGHKFLPDFCKDLTEPVLSPPFLTTACLWVLCSKSYSPDGITWSCFN